MSVHKNRVGGYDVRYRDAAGKHRSKSFRRKRDAERFDLQTKDARQGGTLASLDGGRETLDDYVKHTWIPLNVATLAGSTRAIYAVIYDTHVSPTLGGYELRELTAEVIARWQVDLIAAGDGIEAIRKAHTMLGGILQRAVEAHRITANPQRLVRKAPAAARPEVRPIAPATVEAIRARLLPRHAILVSLLAYAGVRPQEALELLWAHVLEDTIVVHSPKTRRYRSQPRSVRLLAPLAQDLREWKLLSGRPGDLEPVIRAADGGAWSEVGYEQWRAKTWRKTLEAVGLPYQRPYDCRHSFASLLLHEGRSPIYVARQLGHSAKLTMDTYGHVVEELHDQPRITAEEAIFQARRGDDVRKLFGRAD
jgi:integrase